MRFILPILIFLSLTVCFYGQNKTIRKNKPQPVRQSVKLDSAKPVVYIDFVKIAEGEQLNENEPKERIFLKLVNNSKWSIYVPLFAYGGNEKTALYYDVERTRDWQVFDEPVPQGYQEGNGCLVAGRVELKSGNSVNFSIPKNHLAQNLQIRIEFIFDWVWDDEGIYPKIDSSVTFSHSLLEEFLKSAKKSK